MAVCLRVNLHGFSNRGMASKSRHGWKLPALAAFFFFKVRHGYTRRILLVLLVAR